MSFEVSGKSSSEPFAEGHPFGYAVLNSNVALNDSTRSRVGEKNTTMAQAGLAEDQVLLAQRGTPIPGLVHLARLPSGERVTAVPVKMELKAVTSTDAGPSYDPDRWNKNSDVANCYIYSSQRFQSQIQRHVHPHGPGRLRREIREENWYQSWCHCQDPMFFLHEVSVMLLHLILGARI